MIRLSTVIFEYISSNDINEEELRTKLSKILDKSLTIEIFAMGNIAQIYIGGAESKLNIKSINQKLSKL